MDDLGIRMSRRRPDKNSGRSKRSPKQSIFNPLEPIIEKDAERQINVFLWVMYPMALGLCVPWVMQNSDDDEQVVSHAILILAGFILLWFCRIVARLSGIEQADINRITLGFILLFCYGSNIYRALEHHVYTSDPCGLAAKSAENIHRAPTTVFVSRFVLGCGLSLLPLPRHLKLANNLAYTLSCLIGPLGIYVRCGAGSPGAAWWGEVLIWIIAPFVTAAVLVSLTDDLLLRPLWERTLLTSYMHFESAGPRAAMQRALNPVSTPSLPHPPKPAPVPTLFHSISDFERYSRFEPVCELGRGANSSAWLVRDPDDDELVVRKRLTMAMPSTSCRPSSQGGMTCASQATVVDCSADEHANAPEMLVVDSSAAASATGADASAFERCRRNALRDVEREVCILASLSHSNVISYLACYQVRRRTLDLSLCSRRRRTLDLSLCSRRRRITHRLSHAIYPTRGLFSPIPPTPPRSSTQFASSRSLLVAAPCVASSTPIPSTPSPSRRFASSSGQGSSRERSLRFTRNEVRERNAAADPRVPPACAPHLSHL